MMEIFAFVTLIITCLKIALTSTRTAIPNKPCNRVKFGEYWYERKTLLTNVGKPYNLHVHKETNILFFSYSVPETYSDLDFQLAWYNLDTAEYQTIAGIKGGCAIAIDSDKETDNIYLGGSDGIYKFNMMTKIADVYKEKGKNIWGLFHRRNLFYISYPNQRLHIEIDGKFSVVKEFERFEVDQFFVTSMKNDIYFSNKSGLYKFDNVQLKAEVINEFLTVRQIVEDDEGRLYFCTNFGVMADLQSDGLKKILDMKNMHGIAFDKHNDLIYSDGNSIGKLVYSRDGCDQDGVKW